MLRLKPSFLTVAFILVGSLLLIAPRTSSNSNVVRLTRTSEQALNLNPSLSDDGRIVVFETSANLFTGGESSSFHAIRADVFGDPPVVSEIAGTRVVSPALSRDGNTVVFASTEDLVSENADRNSEIFLFNGAGLRQLTHTQPGSSLARLEEGNFQPSITADGRVVAFLSNRDLFLLDVQTGAVTHLTDSEFAASPKISGDGSRVYYQRGSDLVSVDLKTRTKRIVAADVPRLSLTTGRAVSNDGMRLVYSAEVAANETQVFLFDARDNSVRQLTQLGSRSTDVNLQPTISGDGKRVAFATRRRVTSASDGSVELYLYDIPTGQTQQVTNAPAGATAEVVSSLNFDGSLVAFNFPRLMSGPVAGDFENNSEIYLASLAPRPQFGTAKVLNAAAQGNEPEARIAPGSIAAIRGTALAFKAEPQMNTDLGVVLAGTTVKVNGHEAQMFYASPDELVFVVPDGLANGPAEFVVTNSEGFSSKAQAVIASAAPGVFTVSGDGEGEAIVLDSDTQNAGPFDPTNGRLRLSIFATGVSHATNVSVSTNGQPVPVERIVGSGISRASSAAVSTDGQAAVPSGLPGLDEIHVLVPAELRGARTSTLIVTADGVQSNPVSLVLGGSSLRDIVINEILADPPDGLNGDANHDGVRDTSADEFVELVNSTAHDLDLSGYQLQTRSLTATTDTLRHRFAPATILFGGTAIVVFGGGTPAAGNPIFGGSQVVKASTGGLSFVNSGGLVTLRNPAGEIVTSVAYGLSLGLRGDQNQSLTRSPDITGDFLLHSVASDRNLSPGTRADGSMFIHVSPVPAPTPTPESKRPVVITQLFGGGGNTGAPYRNDFIEIFNSGQSPINLAGWSVQYASATASTWSVTPLSSITLNPGQYYLVQEASGGSNGVALPTPDAVGTIAMAATAGKVALIKTTTPLSGTCPNDPNVVDLVGYGSTANCFGGTAPAPAPSNTNAILRASNGCTDTRNNTTDFKTGNPNPRNTAAPANICAQLTARFDSLRLIHALSHTRYHFPARAFWLRQLPRRPT